jgi:hypothetical protein
MQESRRGKGFHNAVSRHPVSPHSRAALHVRVFRIPGIDAAEGIPWMGQGFGKAEETLSNQEVSGKEPCEGDENGPGKILSAL